MLIRTVSGRHGGVARSPCRGAVLPWLVFTAPVLLAVFVLATQMASLRHRQLELQTTADACTLGAADDLVSDSLLTTDPTRYDTLVRNARATALRYAGYNRIDGKPLDLKANVENYNDGELVVGTLDGPNSRSFDVLFRQEDNPFRPYLNAVRITVRRSGAATSSTAYVDRDVIGFKIQGSQALPGQTVPAIPVAPLALLTDACVPGQETLDQWRHKDPRSWEYQILARQGRDAWSVGPDGKPQSGPDQIPEIEVVVTATGLDAKDNGRMAAVGNSSPAQAVRQLTTGLTADDMQTRGGQLLLNDGLGTKQPDNRLVLPSMSLSADDISALARGLQSIVGQRRVWPLYDGQTTGSDKNLVIRGFVAARVVEVRSQTTTGNNGKKSPQIVVVLQPCTLVTAAAVTERDRRDLGPRSLYNPYVARVRLVE